MRCNWWSLFLGNSDCRSESNPPSSSWPSPNTYQQHPCNDDGTIYYDPKFGELERQHLNLQPPRANILQHPDDVDPNSIAPTTDADSYDLSNTNSNVTHQYAFKSASVSCDVPECAVLGADILKRGGSAVDAAVTVSLCLGSVNSFSSGIGGGGFMIARITDAGSSNVETLALNFREKAPGAASKDMYENRPLSSKLGGLAVAIPGELAGLYEAYKRGTSGALTWAQLIEPVIELNEKGFVIGAPLATAISLASPLLLAFPDQWGWLLTNSTDIPTVTSTETGIATDSVPMPTGLPGIPAGSNLRPKVQGERVVRPAYANTLRLIANSGSSAIYYDPNGPIAPHLVNSIQRAGGIATLDDFAQYNVEVTDPLEADFYGRKVFTCPSPCSGPVLIFGLNVLAGYSPETNGPNGTYNDFGSIATQRLVETMKFMGASRSQLGDITPNTNNSVKISQIIDKSFADEVRANISDSVTHPWQYYNPAYEAKDPHGTTHFSVMDANGGAVGMTTTVNLFFGSFICDPTTGIILNNEMDDFSQPNESNSFGLEASIYNYIEPHKRPVSSISPAIIVNPEVDHIEMVIGASGGSHITTTVLEGIIRKFGYGISMLDTIKRPRIHHQLLPDVAQMEFGWPEWSKDELEQKGQNVTYIAPASVSNGLYWSPQNKAIIAVADWWRKRGQPAGY